MIECTTEIVATSQEQAERLKGLVQEYHASRGYREGQVQYEVRLVTPQEAKAPVVERQATEARRAIQFLQSVLADATTSDTQPAGESAPQPVSSGDLTEDTSRQALRRKIALLA